MFRALHSSDLHGKYKRLLVDHADTEFDVWIDTGDFFDNRGRVASLGGVIDPLAELAYQRKLVRWKSLGTRFAEWLAGRPAVVVPGNHDFVDLGEVLERAGVQVYRPHLRPFELLGSTWSGLREIP